MEKKVKKRKISVLTIILIMASIYFLYQSGSYYQAQQEKWNECNEARDNAIPLSFDKVTLKEIYSYDFERDWDSWQHCLESRSFLWTLQDVNGSLTIVFIFLTILSWRLDRLIRRT